MQVDIAAKSEPALALDASARDAVVRLAFDSEQKRQAGADRGRIPDGWLRRQMFRRFPISLFESGSVLSTWSGTELATVVVTGDGYHPLTGSLERHILDIYWSDPGAGQIHKVIGFVLQDAASDGVEVVRADISASEAAAPGMVALISAGCLIHHVVVRKVLVPVPTPLGRFAYTGSDEREFARECLVTAARNSLSNVGTMPTEDGLRAYIVRKYRRLNTQSRVSMVAIGNDGLPRGHALVEIVRRPFTGRLEADLVDTFVPAQWKGDGWALRLWQAMENELIARRLDRAQGTVFWQGSSAAPGVLASLQRAGWWLERYSLFLRLSRGASSGNLTQ